ncbi:MAG: DNA alkylation repair protein, partial [Chloroflexi bacterium]
MHPYIVPLKTLFEQNADPAQAVPMKKYMRDQFEYLGIKTPQNVALQKEFYAKYGLPELSELDQILRDLWLLPQREFQYVAGGLLGKFDKQLPPAFIDT